MYVDDGDKWRLGQQILWCKMDTGGNKGRDKTGNMEIISDVFMQNSGYNGDNSIGDQIIGVFNHSHWQEYGDISGSVVIADGGDKGWLLDTLIIQGW